MHAEEDRFLGANEGDDVVGRRSRIEFRDLRSEEGMPG